MDQMNFKKDLLEAGKMTRAIGGLIMVASDLEDLSMLQEFRDQLKTVDSILSTMLVVDRMQKGRDN